MPRFYFDAGTLADNKIIFSGEDVNHMKNVLRLRPGDEVVLCDGQGTDFICKITEYTQKEAILSVIFQKKSDTELPIKIVLYQGLPKKEKMELIIQKSVELGVSEIVPVSMKRCIVKIEDQKSEKKKLDRWSEIAKSAAKQSGRGIIPKVSAVLNLKTAVEQAAGVDSLLVVPYENAKGIASLKNVVAEIKNRMSVASDTVAIFIGPEGGFEESEIDFLKENGARTVSLGHRILRTETAGFTTAAIIMYEIENYMESGSEEL